LVVPVEVAGVALVVVEAVRASALEAAVVIQQRLSCVA
jgi:hypothetical protein